MVHCHLQLETKATVFQLCVGNNRGTFLSDIKSSQISREEVNCPSLVKLGESVLDNMEEYEHAWIEFIGEAPTSGIRIKRTDNSTRLAYIWKTIEQNEDVLPAFLFIHHWARENNLANDSRRSTFTEMDFAFIVLHIMERCGMIRDESAKEICSNEPENIGIRFSVLSKLNRKDRKEHVKCSIDIAKKLLKIFETFDGRDERKRRTFVSIL